jgi:hypothetical protein
MFAQLNIPKAAENESGLLLPASLEVKVDLVLCER